MAFAPSWTVEVLGRPPLITPARHFTYPLQVAGEEDALARGALLLLVRPGTGGSFLATCALGFTSNSVPTGVFACPRATEFCAVAGGYAYIVDSEAPERCTQISLRPVVEVLPVEARGLLLFVGFHSIAAWGPNGLAWQTCRLSYEGLRIAGTTTEALSGFGWDLRSNSEVAFEVDLRTGRCTGELLFAGA